MLTFLQQKGGLCIDCNVFVSRLSLPEQEVNSAAKPYAMLSSSASSLEKLALSKEQKEQMAWIDFGTDPYLAASILNAIETRVQKPEGRR